MYETNFKFKKYLNDKGIKHKFLAKEMNISPTTFSKKINENGGSKFDIKDFRKLTEILKINIHEYFFEKIVDTNANKIKEH